MSPDEVIARALRGEVEDADIPYAVPAILTALKSAGLVVVPYHGRYYTCRTQTRGDMNDR